MATTKATEELIELAVIGGGPKAAALAAKAEVLQKLGKLNVRVTIFEPKAIGSNWKGDGGYTNGKQRLCTLAERDVGYPYSSLFGKDVDLRIAAEYSWGRFLHDRPGGRGFGTWVDAGRKPPYHEDYARYLDWVIKAARTTVLPNEVVSLSKDGSRWRVGTRAADGKRTLVATRFNGVVATGPGPARRIRLSKKPGATVPVSKIFNGEDFWLRLGEVRRGLKEMTRRGNDDAQIVVVGAGGTAAAILSWLIDAGARDRPIVMVANQASLYTRVDSVFENRLFTDDTAWSDLSPDSRRAFFDRLNRGVVWSTVMDRVSSATGLTMLDGRADCIRVDSETDWWLSVPRVGGAIQVRPSLLIDATGFDPWWFAALVRGLRPDWRKRTGAWEQAISDYIQLQDDVWADYPPLHAPMVSSHVGAGFGSLMVLGAMSDRILRAYSR